jgi:threonyl-tRNA synthetase
MRIDRSRAAVDGGAESAVDHRRIGRDLGMFATDPLVGPGLPLWLPDGAVVRAELERLVSEQADRDGCRRVYTPVLGKRELFERSGHWRKFSADMFPAMDVGGEQYVLRPANCPHHALVYAAEQHSYRDLPIRLAELGSMFRGELSGVVSGLSRVRQINLDDCHVFCRPDQVAAEVALALRSVKRSYDLLGIELVAYRLSRRGRGDGYLGIDQQWEEAEAVLAGVLDELGLAYRDAPGEAAFYGPKIDLQVLDAGDNEQTLSTVQLDLQQPERFDLAYIGYDGRRHRPVMIHRGLLSSMERLIAHLLERTAGALPPWLSPVQVAIAPVASTHREAGNRLRDRLVAAGLRAQFMEPEESLGARIRNAHERRVPYVAVVGDHEVSEAVVAVRVRDGQRVNLDTEVFISAVTSLVRARRSGLDLGEQVSDR